jgi:glucan phosphorylase
VSAQEAEKRGSSYAPVDIKEDFATTMARMKKAKPEVKKRGKALITRIVEAKEALKRDIKIAYVPNYDMALGKL